jgi:hypothetical protein
VATFLGRKLTAAYSDELGNDFNTRIQGTRLRHTMGPTSLKLYDTASLILRAECTTNDVTFFKHPRWVEHRDGYQTWKLAPLKKSIYSLPTLYKLMHAANNRYLTFLAAIDNPNTGLKAIDKVAKPAANHGRSYRGFNLLLNDDYALFLTISPAGNRRSVVFARPTCARISPSSPLAAAPICSSDCASTV